MILPALLNLHNLFWLRSSRAPSEAATLPKQHGSGTWFWNIQELISRSHMELGVV